MIINCKVCEKRVDTHAIDWDYELCAKCYDEVILSADEPQVPDTRDAAYTWWLDGSTQEGQERAAFNMAWHLQQLKIDALTAKLNKLES